MFRFILLLAILALALSFAPSGVRSTRTVMKMGLDAELSKNFPRDFKNIPLGTEYGDAWDGDGYHAGDSCDS